MMSTEVLWCLKIGFYDHVPPPVNVPRPDEESVSGKYGDFGFDRLGVRVPTLFISPLVPKGGVFRSGEKGRYMEHSSLSATLKGLFGLKEFLTKRDSWALSMHNLDRYGDGVRDCLGVIE
jgi:phospholipase C